MDDWPIVYQPVALAPNEDPADREFAAVARYPGDLALLNYLLQDLRVLVRRACKGEIDLRCQQIVSWDVHGLQRRTVVCDPDGLRTDQIVHMVGFFGDRRQVIDEPTLHRSEWSLIDEFVNHPGILSYSSIELVDNYWANLVVHLDPADRETWRHCPAHVRAVMDVAPYVYHGVRIHNGCIAGGVVGSATVTIESTKYWDYDVTPVWHAVRRIPGGTTRATNRVIAGQGRPTPGSSRSTPA